jgi:hypothetical protein
LQAFCALFDSKERECSDNDPDWQLSRGAAVFEKLEVNVYGTLSLSPATALVGQVVASTCSSDAMAMQVQGRQYEGAVW